MRLSQPVEMTDDGLCSRKPNFNILGPTSWKYICQINQTGKTVQVPEWVRM